MQIKNLVVVVLALIALVAGELLTEVAESSLATIEQSHHTAVDGLSAPVCVSQHPAGGWCVEQAQMQVAFSHSPVVVEQEIAVSLSLHPGWVLERAWVEGVSMYMGKAPLILPAGSERTSPVQATLFLGACSQPDMHWRIVARWRPKSTNNGAPANSVVATYDIFSNR